MTGNRQANISVLVAPSVSQNVPQLIVQPVQTTEPAELHESKTEPENLEKSN